VIDWLVDSVHILVSLFTVIVLFICDTDDC